MSAWSRRDQRQQPGAIRWSSSIGGGRILAVGATRLYSETDDHDSSAILDRSTGKILATRKTHERAGLNLRDYSLAVTNRETDRLYFATSSGFILALREAGQASPDSSATPAPPKFGYLPARR